VQRPGKPPKLLMTTMTRKSVFGEIEPVKSRSVYESRESEVTWTKNGHPVDVLLGRIGEEQVSTRIARQTPHCWPNTLNSWVVPDSESEHLCLGRIVNGCVTSTRKVLFRRSTGDGVRIRNPQFELPWF
jgi:hypothetical protein